jgi:hypothetical protein
LRHDQETKPTTGIKEETEIQTKGTGNLFNEVIVKNLLNLGKKMNIEV